MRNIISNSYNVCLLQASADVTKDIFDDSWHNIIVSIDGGNGVQFYCDGDHIGTNRLISISIVFLANYIFLFLFFRVCVL